MCEQGLRNFSDLVRAGILAMGDGYRAKLEQLGSGGPLFLRAGALQDHGFTWVGLERFVSSAQVASKRGQPGDVVITTKGNSIGRVGWVPSEAPEFVYSPHLSYWRSLDHARLHPRYLYYWSRSEHFLGQLRNLAFGTDMAPYLSLRDQARLSISLPQIAEQRAIAEVLGALDDKIVANDRVIRLAQALADAKFAEFAIGVDFGAARFDDVAQVGGGGTPKTSVKEYWGGDVLWATPTDVTGLSAPYLTTTKRKITDAGLASCSSPLYPAGSILMTSRATIGAFAIAQRPMAVNQGFIVVNPKDPDLKWWLIHEMRSRVDEFLAQANGATFLELPRGRFKQLSVRRPAPAVARAFAGAVGPLHELSAQLLLENGALAKTRNDLLPLLMSGRLGVKDAETIAEEAL